MNVTRLKGGAGDFDLFVDFDPDTHQYNGYLLYSAAFYMSIEKLTPDFVASTGEVAACTPGGSPVFAEYFVEAPVMFKRDATYYVLFGHCCCFCYQGSGIIVHTSSSPMGPFVVQQGGDIACVPHQDQAASDGGFSDAAWPGASPTPGQGCLYENTSFVSTTRSQQNFVVEVQTSTGVLYVWTGDRWQQAPDGIKGHEPQFWAPLSFDSNGAINKVTWIDEFTMDVV